jgi:hypothetical protein
MIILYMFKSQIGFLYFFPQYYILQTLFETVLRMMREADNVS